MASLRWLLCVVVSLVLLVASIEGVALAAPMPRDVAVGPVPRWVSKLAVPVTAVPAESETGLVDVLIDDQLHLTSTLEHYRRRVRHITSAAGVEEGAEIELTFDPSYERLVLHGLHVVRGGARIDATRTATIRSFDVEDGREDQIYDGSRRVVFLLGDVRAGDVVDFEASIIGQNPVFGGRLNRRIALASSRESLRRHVRILSPSSRPLAFRLANTDITATTRTLATESEWVWQEADTDAFIAEEGAPYWFDGRPSVNISELGSWAEVARWAAELYERMPPPSPALNAKIAEVRAAHPSAAARAEAVLRFVQDDIRYLGIDLGEHSHRPHSASAVFAQRFGDCKDKVMLLVTMLRALGIDVDPALVDTNLGAHIVDELPSPQAFDHVIARLRVDGREIWVDPTRTLERGPLGSTDVPLGRALIASRDTTDLSIIPTTRPSRPASVVRETIRVKNGAATLEVTSTYRGVAANDMRYSLAHRPRSKTKSANLEFYAKRFEGIEASGDYVIEDDEKANVLVTRELYSIPQPVKDGVIPLWAYSLAPAVEVPTVTHRESPLDIGPPMFVRHEVVIEGIAVTLPAATKVSDAFVSFSMRSDPDATGGGMVTYELQTHADSVSVAELPAHLDTLTSINNALAEDARIPLPEAAKPADEKIYLWVGLGMLALFAGSLVVIAGALIAWSAGRRLRWRQVQP